MPRVKRGVTKHARRKKIIKKAKGYISHRKTNFRAAMEASLHAGKHSYEGRKQKKRDYSALWNVRISAGSKAEGVSYSKLMGELKKQKVGLNRKMLAELAAREPEVFKKLVQSVVSK